MDDSKKCGGCGAESHRRRTVFAKTGLVETCDHCDPSLRELRIASSTDRRVWMGHEAAPDKYTKVTDPDGKLRFIAKDEKRVDDEADMSRETTSQDERAERIMALRRTQGRRAPLTQSETLARIMEVQGMMERSNG